VILRKAEQNCTLTLTMRVEDGRIAGATTNTSVLGGDS
jgi:hypothetical protein